jgi:predicted enzyme related to lactoylglutathione lyase
MGRILGLGGIFFRAADPKGLARWYQEHFGIPPGDGRELWRQEAGPTVFATFAQDTAYFGRRDQAFMVNFRVADLDGLLADLAAAGVRIDQTRQDEPYGRFAWVYDPEGNRIELWEPPSEGAPPAA